MKSNKLTCLAYAISLMFLGGCSSLMKHNEAQIASKKAIMDSFPEGHKEDTKIQKEEVIKEIPLVETKKAARFNLVVNKAPVESILKSLVDGTSYSLILPEELSGNISLNLKNVTAFDVLETLKNVYHYDYEVDDKKIVVYPSGIRTKVFVINHLVGKRVGKSDLKVSSGSLTDNPTGANSVSGTGMPNTGLPVTGGANNQNQFNSTRVTTSIESDFWKEIESVSKIMLDKEGRSVVVSPATNTIIVKGLPRELNEVEKYLRKVQAIVDKQVIIEAKLIEVKLGNTMQAGINWAAFGSGNNSRISAGFGQSGSTLGNTGNLTNGSISSAPGSNLVTNALAGGINSMFSLAFQTSNFASILNFLETQGNLQVLSSPRIATLNNQKAILKVGTDEFFITNVTTTSTSTSSGTTSTPSVTTQPFFSGIALDITPQIDDNGMVTMHVHPSISQVSTVTKNVDLGQLGKIVLPLASSSISETDSVVKVENNKIVAIGGLMKQYSNKSNEQIPGLGDIPAVGDAFKNINNNYSKHELVILLKPQIVATYNDWETNLKEIKQRLADFDPPVKNIVVNKK